MNIRAFHSAAIATTPAHAGHCARRGRWRFDLLPVSRRCRKSTFPPFHGAARVLPGASPETMASSVATPLERQFGRIAGVTEMTSSSR